jgi:glucose-6-phosphate isomerase
MSTNRFAPRFAPLRYDPARAFVPFTAVSRTEVIALNERLETARRAVLGGSDSQCGTLPVPRRELTSPRGCGETAFVDLPERMLSDYQQSRGRSELGRILTAGKRLRDTVDRVVVLAAESASLGARVLFQAGCHPYHNELSRGDRGGRPRIYFADDSFDNDATQGLLDLLCHTRRLATVDERWAIVAIDDGSDMLETSAVPRCLLAALLNSCGGDREAVADFVVPIDGPAGWSSVLSTGGLLPAAVMGLDIVRFLQGAAAMNERFRSAPPGDNPALDHAAVSHLMELRHGANSGVFTPWASALESAARWCEDLQPERRGRQQDSATCGGLNINLIVDSVRRDRLMIPSTTVGSESDDNQSVERSGGSLPDLQSAVVQCTKDADALQRRPTADLCLPALDEGALGQFFQMMLLATAIEGHLACDNLDGRKDAEAYESE